MNRRELISGIASAPLLSFVPTNAFGGQRCAWTSLHNAHALLLPGLRNLSAETGLELDLIMDFTRYAIDLMWIKNDVHYRSELVSSDEMELDSYRHIYPGRFLSLIQRSKEKDI